MEYVTNKWVANCCCCFSRTQWYQRRKTLKLCHDEVFERLSNEIDILNFIKASRTLKLFSSVMLRKNQRQLVPYFKSYHIDPDNLKLPENPPPSSVGHLMKNFNPNEDAVDKRILWEITGRKQAGEIFSDESSSDEESEAVNPFLGIGAAMRASLKKEQAQKGLLKVSEKRQAAKNFSV